MKTKRSSTFSRLLKIAGSKRPYLILSAVLAVISSAFSLVPYIIVYLVMAALLTPDFGTKDYIFIRQMALAAVVIVVLRYMLLFASLMFSHVAAFSILYGLRTRLAAHLGKLPMGYFTSNQTGKIKKVLYEDIEEIEKFLAHHIPDLIAGAVVPVLTLVYLFTVDWRMALVALLPLPAAFFLQQKAFDRDRQEERRKNFHDALETMNGTIVEYVRGMPVVKIFNQTVESFTRLKSAAMAYKYFVERITMELAPPWAMFIVITSSGLVFILPFGLWFYHAGYITMPTLLLFLMLGSGYMTPLFKLAMLGGQMSHVMEGVKRMDTILQTPPMSEPAYSVSPRNANIEFRNVSFAYGEKEVLHNVSFSLEEGTVTALVGPSGAGKTTMAQLLLRMWDIKQGEIRLGGVNIREMTHAELMNRVGFVFQDVFIFSDTVYENIRMGMENVARADVARAADIAQCGDLLAKLPKGLETRIGEGGEVHLSGGEKQRIALARVVLKNPSVVILDEATAYTDAENESRIQAAFSEIIRDKTVIVIAHRLSTITDADRILVVKDGRIAESGRHKALLARNGVYQSMWQAHIAAGNWTL